jgi:hypothetical protein
MGCGHRVYSFGKDLIGLSKNHAVAASQQCNTPIRAGLHHAIGRNPRGISSSFELFDGQIHSRDLSPDWGE